MRLEDVAEVRFGIKTGANEFFYLNDEQIHQWGIESEFLKPVIKSPRECKSIRVDPSQLQFKLFMCHADKADLAGTAALEYIEWGESQGYHQRPSCRGRARWYDLGQWDFADLLWIETMHESFKVHRNAPSIYESLGGGGLKTAVYEVKDFHIIQPELLMFSRDLVNDLIQREIGTIQEDIKHNNRLALDEIIFDTLGFTQGEQDGVYEAVVNLVESRLRKARSLKGKS